MPQSATSRIRFKVPAQLPLEVSFDAGRLTSAGGLPWVAEAEDALGLCAAFAAAMPDWRTGPVLHSVAALVRQRVFQIACGYEDQDDADTLRTDPLLKRVCGRRGAPPTGHLTPASAQDRRLGAATQDARPPAAGQQPPRRAALGALGRQPQAIHE